MSDSIKPIHFLKVLNEDFTIKITVFKNTQVEQNDVISNMAETIPFFSSLNQALFDSVSHFSAFGHPKIDVVRVPPLSLVTPQMEGYSGVFPRMQGS